MCRSWLTGLCFTIFSTDVSDWLGLCAAVAILGTRPFINGNSGQPLTLSHLAGPSRVSLFSTLAFVTLLN